MTSRIKLRIERLSEPAWKRVEARVFQRLEHSHYLRPVDLMRSAPGHRVGHTGSRRRACRAPISESRSGLHRRRARQLQGATVDDGLSASVAAPSAQQHEAATDPEVTARVATTGELRRDAAHPEAPDAALAPFSEQGAPTSVR
jgi:hypothetical protein